MADHKPTETNDPTQRSASDHIERGAERVKQATSSAAQSAHKATDSVERGVHRGADKVADATEHTAEYGREKLDAAMEHAGDWTDKACNYVRENPTKSLAMAVAAGWLVGRMMRR